MIRLMVSFLKRYARYKGVSIDCLMKGSHYVDIVKSQNLYHQKEDQPIRYWFDGEYHYCLRRRCNFRRFVGNKNPIAIDRIP